MATVAEFARVSLTDELRSRAWREAMALERRYGPRRPDSRYLGHARGMQRWHGRVGELAFLRFLEKVALPYEEHPPTTSGGDAWDMRIFEARCDVKTSTLTRPVESVDARRYGFVLAAEQIQKPVDCYVLVYLSATIQAAYIAGFVRRDQVVATWPTLRGTMIHPGVRIPLLEAAPIWGLWSFAKQFRAAG